MTPPIHPISTPRPAHASRIVTGAVTGLLLMLSACGSPEEKASKAAQRFEVAYARHDLLRARIEINTALQAQDDVPEYWNKLGRVELGLRKYYNAYAAYTRALELDKGNAEAMQAVAELSYSGGSPDDAVKYADRMLLLEPRNLRMMFVKGSVAFDQQKVDEARVIAQRMLAIDPANEGGSILLARTRYAAADPKGAIATLEGSIARDGVTMTKLIALLDFYSDQGDLAGIDRTYARMFRLQPNDIPLRLGFAKSLYDNDRPDRAMMVVDRLLQANPRNAGLQQQIVDLWLAVGSKAVAIDQVRRFAAAGNDKMKVALGQIAVDQHRYAEAEQILKPFVDKGDIDPTNVLANALYASALSGLGRKDEALVRASRVLDFDRTNPQALLLRIQISIERHNLDLALTDAQILGRDNPELASGRIVLAQVYTLRKERLLADGVFGRAADDLPADLDLLQAYIAYLIDTDRRDQALDVADRFTRRNSNNLDGWKARADLCLSLDDDPCLRGALAALSHVRGGEKIRGPLMVAMARKQKDSRLAADPLANLPQILSGHVGLEAATSALIAQGRATDAEKLAKAVVARQPGNMAADLVLADIALVRGNRAGAEAAIMAVIRRNPAQAAGYRDLARLRFGAGDRPGALAALNQGLKRLPGDTVLLSELATIQQASGDTIAAANSYRLLAARDPGNLVALNNLITILIESRSPASLQEARLLAKRIETVDQPAFLDTRGWLAFRTGDIVGANALLKRAVDSAQPAPVFHYHYAEALLAAGNRAGARVQAKAALAGAGGGDPWLARARALLQAQ